jgi:hypothetical protein
MAARKPKLEDIDNEMIMVTVVLRHDQSKSMEELQGHLNDKGWWEHFPPEGVEVVTWNVVMGIGQIVTLRLPPRLLNHVNVAVEKSAWGAFATEFYPTYDFVPVRERLKRQAKAGSRTQTRNKTRKRRSS